MYFLLAEFEVRIKKTPRGYVIYSLDQETEANKMPTSSAGLFPSKI